MPFGFGQKKMRQRGRLLWLTAALLFPVTPLWADVIPVEFGGEFLGEVVDPEVLVEYSINALPGVVVFVDQTTSASASDLKWTLKDAFGRVLAETAPFVDDLGPTALMGGSYILSIASAGGGVGPFSFVVYDVTPSTTTVALGELVTGEVQIPGQVHRYQVEVDAPSTLNLDVVAGDAFELRWGLEDSLGNLRQPLDSFFFDYGPFVVSEGVHTVTVSGSLDAIGPYEFKLTQGPLSTDTEPVSIELNSDVSDSIRPELAPCEPR